MSTLHYPYQPECVHAASSHGNYDTLCSFDPDAYGDERDAVAVVHDRARRVTCRDCAAIIHASRGHRIAPAAVAPRRHPSGDGPAPMAFCGKVLGAGPWSCVLPPGHGGDCADALAS